MGELEILEQRLDAACCPEEVFGSGDDPAIVYRKLARACHPDLHSDPIAPRVFQKLDALKQEAENRVRKGIWGKRTPLPHCKPVSIGTYLAKPYKKVGDIADLFVIDGKSQIIKVARYHDDNDLLRAENEALLTLASIKGPVSEGVPKLLDNFWVEGAWKREANLLTFFPGFVNAQDVRAKIQVEARAAVWMFKRILSLLTWVHHLGLVHGAILPPHVLFYPDNDGNNLVDPRKHSVRLVDWCYSVNFAARTRLSSWVPAWQAHYAPEILQKKSIGAPADIFMAASLIRYLCGKLPAKLERVLDSCLNPDPEKRPQKAADVFEAWKQAAAAEFGAPKWVDFNLP